MKSASYDKEIGRLLVSDKEDESWFFDTKVDWALVSVFDFKVYAVSAEVEKVGTVELGNLSLWPPWCDLSWLLEIL